MRCARLPYKERTANAIEGNHIGTWMDGQINERFLWRLHGWDVGFLWMISDEAEGGAC